MPPTSKAENGPTEANGQNFSLAASAQLERGNFVAPVLFAGVYALVSALVEPWPVGAVWFGAIAVWEVVTNLWVDPRSRALPPDTAVRVMSLYNFVGACLYGVLPLICLASGAPLGVALGATWLSGSFVNIVVHYGDNKRLMWWTMAPSLAVALTGPFLAHGFSLAAAGISFLILCTLVAAWSFSEDHTSLLRQLGQRQSTLDDLESKLAVAVEASGDGLFEADLIAHTSKVSLGWAAMLGYQVHEVDAHELIEFVHPDDRPILNREYDEHFRGETSHITCEVRLRCKDGSYKWVLSRARLVARAPDGQPWRVIGTTVDISERMAMQLRLEAALAQAEQANAAMNMFVANMSHEIRTPLNGVIGVAGVLARTELNVEQREMVALVQSSAQVLERLLTDILDQSKLEAGEFELEVAPFDLRDAIESACDLMRPRAADKGLDFVVAYDGDASGRFRGDAVRLRQVICNLAANAVKFTDHGEVRVTVHVPDVRDDDAGDVSIVVSDTGIGFDADTAERLFSRFVQADGSISRRYGGSGLGLAISKALTELMGGSISVSSEPGVGSRFELRLPLPRETPAAAGEDEAAVDEDEGISLAGLRVLVAEDHPTNQQVIRLMLEPFGVRLTLVDDGEAAVEAFAPGRFDVILMDMQMPKLDGLSATRQIRAQERAHGGAPTPIAMLTANAMEAHRREAKAAGADYHIAKPITPESLFAGLTAVLDPSEQRAGDPLAAEPRADDTAAA